MMYYSHDGGWWWVMAITSTIFWLAVIAGIVMVAVWTARFADRPGAQGPASARTILEERFARGEISAEEFQQRLRTLRESPQT